MAEHDLQSIAFPTLDETQVARLSRCTYAVSRSFEDGQTLFAVGQRNFGFFVVKSGAIEIVDLSGDEPRTVTTHHVGEFTGDLSHLTGAPAVVSAIARGPCQVLEVSGEALRRVLNQCADLSDLILQAFLARRQLLRQSSTFTGLLVIGSRYSPDTFRVRDFLAKNRALFTWVDVETDPQRLCLTSGHVDCCDSSKNKHATKHFHATGHPIMKSAEPGEDWGWCYIDQMTFDPL